MKSKKGQILVVVLLVVVVSLAIGLSVASRNVTNLKSSTQAEQSQRAFTAAEGGVESALSKLNDVATLINGSSTSGSGCIKSSTPGAPATCGLGNTPTGIDANTDLTQSKSTVVVTANNAYERVVGLGDVAQVNLQGLGGGSTVVIKWAKNANANEATPNHATLEFTFVCDHDNSTTCFNDTKTASAYGQHRDAVTIDSISSQSGGFVTCGNSGTSLVTAVTSGGTFYCTATFTLPGTAPALTNALILRIKPFWNGTTVNVSGTNTTSGASFPVQTYDITSTATTDNGLSRKVQVSRDALPQLPAIFDYVLYSGGDIIK